MRTMRRFVQLFCVAGGCLAQEPNAAPRPVPPHISSTSPKFFTPRSHVEGDGMAQLATTIKAQSRDLMEVLVTWKDAPSHLHPTDWIGVFDYKLMTQFHSPVKFRYVFPLHAKYPLQNYGSMNFTVKNLRSSYVFIYISGDQQFPSIIAQSLPVNFDSIDHPQMPHIALSPSDPKKMIVMWTQNSPQSPMLKFGTSADKLEHSVPASIDTYVKDDFCDEGISPASRQGWFEPGKFMKAEMPIEPGQTYFYTCGDEDNGWLEEVRNFTAPPAANSNSTTRLIMFADLGNAPDDGSLQHSWDFANHGELPSRNTTRLTQHLFDKHGAHAVVHFGDIAYAVGYLSEWDEFFLQIEPVASRVPWMASIGNHEQGWSQSDPFNGTLRTSMDSGGECGVAFLKRFPFAMQPMRPSKPFREAQSWYSFNVGLAHFTMLSSEHDFRAGSPQWKWMVSDLASVDRSATPWIIVTSHRAMYIASDYDGDQNVAELLRTHVEAELLKYGVDFFLAGHHHSYQRFCKLSNGTCVDEQNKDGVYHFVMGMAGYWHSPVGKNFTQAQFTDDQHWGATYWDFSETSATMQFLDGATDEVIDTKVFQKASVLHEIAVVI